MEGTADYLVLAAFAAIGAAFVVGAYRRWSWLVDPPMKFWPFYSQALIKKVLGRDIVILFTYIVGLAMIAITLAILWKGFASSPGVPRA